MSFSSYNLFIKQLFNNISVGKFSIIGEIVNSVTELAAEGSFIF